MRDPNLTLGNGGKEEIQRAIDYLSDPSALPAASSLDGTELVPVVQDGATKRTTAQDIADLGGGGNAFEFIEIGDAPATTGAIRLSADGFLVSDTTLDYEVRMIGVESGDGHLYIDPDSQGTILGGDITASDSIYFANAVSPVRVRAIVDIDNLPALFFNILSCLGLRLNPGSTNGIDFYNNAFDALIPFISVDGSDNLTLTLKNIPTSAAGLTEGQVWRDPAANNVLKVVPPA